MQADICALALFISIMWWVSLVIATMSTGPYGVSYSSIVCVVCSCSSVLIFCMIFCFRCCSVMVISSLPLDHGIGV